MMDIEKYRIKTREWSLYEQTPLIHKDNDVTLLILALGLCGESGEFGEKVKKLVRDSDGEISPEILAPMVKELGDVLFYFCRCIDTLGLTVQDIIDKNVEKLTDRHSRDAVKGSGDER